MSLGPGRRARGHLGLHPHGAGGPHEVSCANPEGPAAAAPRGHHADELHGPKLKDTIPYFTQIFSTK